MCTVSMLNSTKLDFLGLCKVVSLNPVHDDVYSIQHYVIKFVSDLWWVSGFLRVRY
jgi:hypothetical protein